MPFRDRTVLVGPPPPELARYFAQLKACILAHLWFWLTETVAILILTDAPIALLSILFENFTDVILLLLGIWVLKHEPCFGTIFTCLTYTIFCPCAEGCPNSIGCLSLFALFNGTSAVFSLLTATVGSEFLILLARAHERLAGQDRITGEVAYSLFWLSRLLLILVDCVSAVVACRAHSKAVSLVSRGDAPPSLPLRRLDAPPQRLDTFGDSPILPPPPGRRVLAPPRVVAPSQRREMNGDSPTRSILSPMPGGSFQGQGHRLGL